MPIFAPELNSVKLVTVTDWIGSFGVFVILLAYFLSTTNKISSQSLIYIFLNLVGACMACIASVLLFYWPFIILEAAWALVSFLGLLKHFRKKHLYQRSEKAGENHPLS